MFRAGETRLLLIPFHYWKLAQLYSSLVFLVLRGSYSNTLDVNFHWNCVLVCSERLVCWSTLSARIPYCFYHPPFFFEYPQVTVFVNTISANKNFHWISTRFLHQLCLLTRSVSAQLVGIYYAALPYILRFRCRYFLTPNTCYLLQWITCSGFLLVFPLQMGLDNKLL